MSGKPKRDAIKTIRSFSKLKRGWNAGSGLPVPRLAMRRAVRLIRLLPVIPEIFPTGRRTIQFEFGDYEMEIPGYRAK